MNSLLETLRAIYNIQDNGEVSFAGELLRNGKLADAKWSSRKTKSRKENSRTALSQLDGNFVTKHKIPVYSLFTFALSENVFCQGTVVLLNLV